MGKDLKEKLCLFSMDLLNLAICEGYYVDDKTGKKYLTTYGIVHYSKTGFHVVPSKPEDFKEEK